jgi:hypothetical protein
MAKEALRKSWNRPEIKRLGELKDVSGAQTGGPQANPAKS